MKDEKVMITCCSDGTRPVIFKIERLDYKVLYIDGISCDGCREKIRSALEKFCFSALFLLTKSVRIIIIFL